MAIYCDESGGISAGAMVIAGVSITPPNADALLARFKDVTGLRGEMKGSRISLVERALFFELLERFDGRAIIFRTPATRAAAPDPVKKANDLETYVSLLERVITAWLAEDPKCAQVIIDDGRYAPETLGLVRADIAALLGRCGSASLADSRRSPGVQIADVIANSVYNLAVRSTRSERIARIIDPFVRDKLLKIRPN